MAAVVVNDAFDALAFDEAEHPTGPHAPSVDTVPGRPAAIGVVEFSPPAYLEAFPEVADSIAAAAVHSALDHYMRVGQGERRLERLDYLRALAGGTTEQPAHGVMSFNIDTSMVSTSGTFFVVGWSDDRETALASLSAIQATEGWNTRGVARCRRADVEDLLQSPPGHRFGFWAVHQLARFDPKAVVLLRARFADGRFTQVELRPRMVSDVELREIILGHFASLQYPGNRDIESAQQLEHGAGEELVALNRAISKRITAAAHVERYGPERARFSASFIVCLFGKSEYFFLQNALFGSAPERRDVEFIYVSNSPELTEALQKEARIADLIYGQSLTLVTLPGNAGFSAANNVAASFARSDRIVFINPDVFPRDDSWARVHADIVASRPRNETALFGAPLYYDDGSLMHGGMYFDVDRGISVTATDIQVSSMIRVEHYGKGAPERSNRYTAPRPVPAVTGAFISADHSWFDALGGFTEDYLFGHYEDADLCLKSLQRDTPVWIQDVRFWHLEGKGSVRRPPHEGGSLVNRWLFSRNWAKTIEADLVGRTPRHKLLNQPAAPVAASRSPMSKALSRPAAAAVRPGRKVER